MKMYNPRNPAEFVEDLGDSLVEFFESKGWVHGEADYVDMPAILGEPAPVVEFAALSTEPPIDFDAISKSKKTKAD